MNRDLASAHEELPLTLVQRLDHVCSNFESACQAAGASGPLPILEDFLKDRAEADGSVLRRELILLEVHYRRRRGEHPGAPEFAGRFPDLAPTWLAEALGTSTELPHDTPVSSAPPAARSALATDANLLFGILALQADAITRDRFVEACTLWASAKDLALADLLVQRGWLAASDRADVERLVERKLRKHSGDLKTSLAEVAGAEVHRSLSGLADTDVQHSLAALPPAPGQFLPTTHTFQLESRDRYALTRLHAKGGIGQVWLAHDSDLGRDVALKELRSEQAANPAIWARFVEEAKITGQLEHPGIVPVYELARRSADQKPFYTMRFVKGRTLSAAVKEYHANRQAGRARRLDLRELLGAFVDVCNAVAYAHSRGVLHRDLKGQNIALGKYGEVMVLDWGLAKASGEKGKDSVARAELTSLLPVALQKQDSRDQTMQGQVLGTPGYMPPEQAEGHLAHVDERSDIYGLGAILYEILTGRPPFEGADTQEVIQKVLNERPPWPGALVPGTPRALEAVCLKALAKKPAERYASVSELAQEVQHFLADEPVMAYREPLPARALRWGRRHQTLAASAAVLLLAAVAALTVGTLLLSHKQREIVAERNAASQAADQAQKAAAEAQAVSNFLTADLLGQASPDENARDKKVTVEELLHRAAKKVVDNPSFAKQPAVEATLRLVIGNTYFKLGNVKDAEPHLRQALVLRRTLGAAHADTLVAQEALAWFLTGGLHKYDEAEPLSRQTWEARSQLLGPEHADTLDSMDTYAITTARCGKRKEGARLERLCLEARTRTLDKQHPDIQTSQNNLATILIEAGEWPEAEALLRDSFDMRRQKGLDKVETLACLNNLSYAVLLQGRAQEAEKLLAPGIEVMRQSHGEDHIRTVHLQHLMSRILLAENRLPQAEELATKVLTWRRKLLPAGNEDIGRTLAVLGQILVKRDRHAEAERLLREAAGIFRQDHAHLDDLLADAEHWLGVCLAARGQFPEAEALLLASYKTLAACPGVPAPQKTEALDHIVKLYDTWKKPDQARDWRARATENRTKN
jgi:tetratricopeptide (TPR) repeat protein/tRNA A-37 threonylcarbamoyl transferase component Bud32